MREKLIEWCEDVILSCKASLCVDCEHNGIDYPKCMGVHFADHLIANGVTVQQWIPVSEQPNENGYYLCVIVFSAVGHKKEYRRKILFWEDNIWIEKPNSFRTEKPLYWMPMAEMPTPPKEE